MSALRGCGVLFATAALACALPNESPRPAPALAGLSVEIHGGLSSGQEWAGVGLAAEARVPVEIILDATVSMAERVSGRVTRSDTARQLAVRYLDALPVDVPVRLRVPGITTGPGCGPAVPIEPASGRPVAESLAALVPSLPPPRGESSIAAALNDVARQLARADAPAARVVLLSDLAPDCGGDLCAAARELVERGAELEIVDLGDGEPPACLADLASRKAPAPLVRMSRPPAPAFRAERPPGADEAEPLELLGRGRADSGLLSVASGRVVVTVELDPPIAVGPLDLLPGETARIRVLDFPSLDPPVREVWVEGGGRSADVPTGIREPDEGTDEASDA